MKNGRAPACWRRRGCWTVIRDCRSSPTAAKARCRRLGITQSQVPAAEARNEQAPQALHCDGKAEGPWHPGYLGGHRTWQPSASGSALAVQKGRMGVSAALRPEATRQVLVFVVAECASPGDLRGTPWLFVTTHWPCAAECVHSKIPSSSPRPWGRPPLQRLL